MSMSLSLSDFASKIPAVGIFFEVGCIYTDYKKQSQTIQKSNSRLKIIKTDLEKKNFSNSNVIETISRINSKIEEQKTSAYQLKSDAVKNTCLVFLQEGANALVYGGGSLVAAVSYVYSTTFNTTTTAEDLYQRTQEGVMTGVKDYILTAAADVALDNCSIQ